MAAGDADECPLDEDGADVALWEDGVECGSGAPVDTLSEASFSDGTS